MATYQQLLRRGRRRGNTLPGRLWAPVVHSGFPAEFHRSGPLWDTLRELFPNRTLSLEKTKQSIYQQARNSVQTYGSRYRCLNILRYFHGFIYPVYRIRICKILFHTSCLYFLKNSVILACIHLVYCHIFTVVLFPSNAKPEAANLIRNQPEEAKSVKAIFPQLQDRRECLQERRTANRTANNLFQKTLNSTFPTLEYIRSSPEFQENALLPALIYNI